MDRHEYEYLQDRFSKLLAKADYLIRNKEQAYKDGVLAAKSVLKEVFERQQEREAQHGKASESI